LPGLYGPVAFLRGLGDAEQVFKQIRDQSSSQREARLSQYHRARINSISTAWFRDIAAIGGKAPAGLSLIQTPEGEALRVMELAVTKAVTEASILRSMTAGALALGRITDESAWNKIAALYANENRLDATSIELIRRQTNRLFAKEESPDTRLNNMVKKLQQSLALDTVRNEYLLHTTLHAWLTTDASRQNVDDLNEKVYAQLFLTPRSDPWFGLYSADTYTGLDNGGVVR
jgi:hypothetical protein